MEKRIGWLSPVAPPEHIIIDSSGNEVVLTPEQLAIIYAHEQAKDESLRELMVWLGVKTVEEAEDFLADLETNKQ